MSEASVPRDESGGHDWRYYLQSKILVILFLGFSAGLPFMLVYSTLTIRLQESGLATSTISTFAWIGFAYSFKFLWAPLVDTMRIPLLSNWLGRRRAWLLITQIGLGVGIFTMAQLDPAASLMVFASVAVAVAFFSATQDIALDAYRVELASDEMQGVLAAAYQYGYRIAVLVAYAGALYIADFASWKFSYMIMAAFTSVGLITTIFCREPEVAVQARHDFSGTSTEKVVKWLRAAVVDPFADFMTRYGRVAILLLLLIALFRISDYVLGVLAGPYYVIAGFTKSEIATVAKVYGLWVTLAGIALGGWSVLKMGMPRSVVVATILIASTNLFFAALVLTGAELWMLTTTITFDNIASGFSGTVFIAYLSSLTSVSFTATQYALFSSMSSFLGKLTAGFSGNIQESIGWFNFFLYAAALGVPAIILSVIVAKRMPHKRD